MSEKWQLPDWQMRLPADFKAEHFYDAMIHPVVGPLLQSVHFLCLTRLAVREQELLPSFLQVGQLINYVPGREIIDNKCWMADGFKAIDEYLETNNNRIESGWGKCVSDAKEFVPTTYKIPGTIPTSAQETDYWILKTQWGARGEGIAVAKDLVDLLEPWEKKFKSSCSIIQKYIENPLLVDGRKFSIRFNALVLQTNPLIVGSFVSMVLLTSKDYYLDDDTLQDPHIHLTNNYVKDNRTGQQTLQSHVEHGNQFLESVFTNPVDLLQIKQQMYEQTLYSLKSINSSHWDNPGFIDVFAFDFMMDDDWNVYLLEMNFLPNLPFELTMETVGIFESLIEIKTQAHSLALKNVARGDLWQEFHEKYKHYPVVKQGNTERELLWNIFINESLDPPFYNTTLCGNP